MHLGLTTPVCWGFIISNVRPHRWGADSCTSVLYPYRHWGPFVLMVCPLYPYTWVTWLTTATSLTHASLACWDYTLAWDQTRIQQLLNIMIGCCYLPITSPSSSTVGNLAGEADGCLFRVILGHPYHVLRKLLTCLWKQQVRLSTEDPLFHFASNGSW